MTASDREAGRPRPRFDVTEPVPPWQELGAVHLVAIGGIGMSAVARLLLAHGVPVTGSDTADSAPVAALRAAGASVHLGHDARHLGGAQTVVVSSAIRPDNPEVAAARARGLRVLHRSQALVSALSGRRLVAVAGASGKTTTTAMLVVALQGAGLDPGYAIGGELARDGTNAGLGSGDLAVVEADESDGSFLVYRPEVAVVTSVQPDHLDFYRTAANVEAAYRDFVDTLRPGGTLVAGADDPGARELARWAAERRVRVVTYGFAADADVRLTEVTPVRSGSTATVSLPTGPHPLALQVPGRYNLLDAAGALTAAVVGLGQPADLVAGALAGFTGTRRRFEPRGAAAGVQVVDDYAHNPAKVAAVVETATGVLPRGGRLVAVFQPHLYSRTRDFAEALGAGLAPADVVVVMDVYPAREDPIPGITGRLVADAVTAARPHADVHYEPDRERVAPLLRQLLRPGDLVVTVGAGDVTRIGPQLLELLAAEAPSEERS